MSAHLLYIVIAFSGPTWHGAMPIHETRDQARCERMATQLSTTGKRYACHTRVVTTLPAKQS